MKIGVRVHGSAERLGNSVSLERRLDRLVARRRKRRLMRSLTLFGGEQFQTLGFDDGSASQDSANFLITPNGNER